MNPKSRYANATELVSDIQSNLSKPTNRYGIELIAHCARQNRTQQQDKQQAECLRLRACVII